MALKFNCKHCGEPMIVKFLEVGETAQCKNCGGMNAVPDSAVETTDAPDYATTKAHAEELPQGLPLPEEIVGTNPGFWIRALARIIDSITEQTAMIVALILAGIIAGIVGIIAGASPASIAEKLEANVPVAVVVGTLGSIVYHTVCEGLHGASLGKLICGLSRRCEGGPLTMRFRRGLWPVGGVPC